MGICPKCYARYNDIDKYCWSCGLYFEGNNQTFQKKANYNIISFDENVSYVNFIPRVARFIVEKGQINIIELINKFELPSDGIKTILTLLDDIGIIKIGNGNYEIIKTKEEMNYVFFQKKYSPSFYVKQLHTDWYSYSTDYNSKVNIEDIIRYVVRNNSMNMFNVINLFHLNSKNSSDLRDDLIQFGIIDMESKKIIMEEWEFDRIINSYERELENDIFGFEKNKEDEKDLNDNMTGAEFEDYCVSILRKNGFNNVKKTKASGDHGVDITASKDDIFYVFQCKCYSSSVGNSAVQEVYAGKKYYDADIAIVMTNSYFTSQAIDDAKKLKVKLWGKEKLKEML